MPTQPVSEAQLRLTRIAILQRERDRLTRDYRRELDRIDLQIRTLSGPHEATPAQRQ